MSREPRSIRVEAVVLRHIDWGDMDRIIHVFSRQRGKLRTVAKGIRRPRSRKAGHLEPFSWVSLQLARGRDLWIITQVETIQPFIAIGEDLIRMGYAALVVEMIDRFAFESEANPTLFRLLTRTLTKIADCEDVYPVIGFYSIRMLDLNGFRPELFNCLGCGEEITAQNQYISPAVGGALCPRCGPSAPASRQISMDALKYLRHFLRSPFEQAVSVKIPLAIEREMEHLMSDYLSYHLEKKLNASTFLKNVRR